jgi:PIN domain nuclease of toxin-antitoxin system
VRVLFDTQCWLWLQSEKVERFSRRTLAAVGDPKTERFLSIASVWEICIKYALGKLRLPRPPDEYIPARLRTSVTEALAIDMRHVLLVATLPLLHGDPFDRLLIAQARAEGLALLSSDRHFAEYGVDLLPL